MVGRREDFALGTAFPLVCSQLKVRGELWKSKFKLQDLFSKLSVGRCFFSEKDALVYHSLSTPDVRFKCILNLIFQKIQM